MTGLVDLNPVHLAIVEHILAEHVPECEVRAFGSRATWNARDTSDLDLAIIGDGSLPNRTLTMLKEAFEESRLPMRVDVIDWNAITDSFRESIDPDSVVVQGAAASSPWPVVRLGDCIVTNEETISSKDAWAYINYLDTGNITENRIDEIQHLVVGEDKVPVRARRKVREGDIVYSTVRPNQRHYGLLKDIPENLLASTGFVVIRGKEGVAHTDFVYWLLAQDHIVEYLQTIAEHSTSAYPSIRPSDIETIEFSRPPPEEQWRIAGILGTLNDKIELNRRMSETLEEMARALFKSWFVDFDPVRAKANDQPSGLPPDLDALFPASFEMSELGEIPAGWEVKTLEEAIDVNPRRPIQRGDIAMHVEMAALPKSGYHITEWKQRAFTSGSRFALGDTLLARITPSLENGKTAFVDCLTDGEMGWGSTEFIVLRPKPPWPPELAYVLAREPNFREHAIVNMTGTSGRQRVPVEAVSAYRITAPPDSVAVAFGASVRLWFDRATRLNRQARALAEQRDVLLPRLVSGAVRLSPRGDR